GFGRIGRAFVRETYNNPDITLVAVNDLGSLENLAYLLQHDTVYGRAPFTISVAGNSLVIDGEPVRFLSEKEPAHLQWKDLNIDVVIESTGLFTEYAKAKAHLDAGARRVVITAPVKGESPLGATILMGLDEDGEGEKFRTCPITSNAS